MTWQLFTGLDFQAPMDVYAQGSLSLLDLSSGYTITASLLSADGQTVIISDTAQASGTSGAAWATGRVVVVFPAASTLTAFPLIGTTAKVGIQLTVGGKTYSLPLIPCDVLKGY